MAKPSRANPSKPVIKTASKPAKKSVVKPASKPSAKQPSKSGVKAAVIAGNTKPVAKPTVKKPASKSPASKPAAKSETQPTLKTTTKPSAKPGSQPAGKAGTPPATRDAKALKPVGPAKSTGLNRPAVSDTGSKGKPVIVVTAKSATPSSKPGTAPAAAKPVPGKPVPNVPAAVKPVASKPVTGGKPGAKPASGGTANGKPVVPPGKLALTQPASPQAVDAGKKPGPKGITVVTPKPSKKPKARVLEMPIEPLFKPGAKWKPLIASGPKAPPSTGIPGVSTVAEYIADPKAKLNRKELDRYHEVLLAKRAELVGDISTIEDEALRQSSGSLSSLPQHMAEQGTDAFDQALSLDLAQVDRDLLREIDAALKRIDEGTYGVCERTGKRIATDRLAELPWARYSIEAAREMERRIITTGEASSDDDDL